MRPKPSRLKRFPLTDSCLKCVFQNISYKGHVLKYTNVIFRINNLYFHSTVQLSLLRPVSFHSPENKS